MFCNVILQYLFGGLIESVELLCSNIQLISLLSSICLRKTQQADLSNAMLESHCNVCTLQKTSSLSVTYAKPLPSGLCKQRISSSIHSANNLYHVSSEANEKYATWVPVHLESEPGQKKLFTFFRFHL